MQTDDVVIACGCCCRRCGDDPGVLHEARRRFAIYAGDESPDKPNGARILPPEISAPIFKLVMAHGDESTLAKLT